MKRHLIFELEPDDHERLLFPMGSAGIELDVADVDTAVLESRAHAVVDDHPVDHDRLSFGEPTDEYTVTKYDGVDLERLVDGVENLAEQLESEGKTRGEDLGEPYRRLAARLDGLLDATVPNRDADDGVSKPPEHRYYDVDDRFVNLRVTVDGEEYTDSVREKELAKGLPDDVDVYVDRVRALDLEQPGSGGEE